MCRRSSSWKVLQLFKTKEVSMRLIPLHPHSWVSWLLIRLCLLCKSIFISCSTHCPWLSQLCPPFLSLLMTTAVKRGESQWTVSRASASVEYYYQVWCMTRNKIKKIFAKMHWVANGKGNDQINCKLFFNRFHSKWFGVIFRSCDIIKTLLQVYTDIPVVFWQRRATERGELCYHSDTEQETTRQIMIKV